MTRVQLSRAAEGYSVPAPGVVQGLVVDCANGGGGGDGCTWVRVLEAGDDVLVARIFVRGNVQAPGAEMRATPHPRTAHRAIKTAALQGCAGIEIWNVTATVRALGLDQAVGDEISCIVHGSCTFVHGSCTAPMQPGFSKLLFQPLAPFLLLARDFRFAHGLEVGGVRGGRQMRSI